MTADRKPFNNTCDVVWCQVDHPDNVYTGAHRADYGPFMSTDSANDISVRLLLPQKTIGQYGEPFVHVFYVISGEQRLLELGRELVDELAMLLTVLSPESLRELAHTLSAVSQLALTP